MATGHTGDGVLPPGLEAIATAAHDRLHAQAGQDLSAEQDAQRRVTEAATASASPGRSGSRCPATEVRVVDTHGPPVPQGERGEVVIRGANVMRGHLNRPEDTAKTIVDGWLHSGDVGIFDADGYLRIVDRIKDMIIRGGENIYPKEIETPLYAHERVLEAAVVGRPDDVLGEVVVAYVALRAGEDVTLEELRELCIERLAKYKRPAAIEVLDQLPKNAVGKIDKPELRRRAAA